jgi:hypothetical protein
MVELRQKGEKTARPADDDQESGHEQAGPTMKKNPEIPRYHDQSPSIVGSL